MVQHEIPPVFDENSRVLVLGSFPSVQSRKAAFFYGHPQNRFWRVLSAVFGEPVPGDIPEKKALLLKHKVALWDVIASCDVTGSADASIKNVVPNDLSVLLSTANITHVYTNGQMPLRYNNDKQKKPLFSRGLSVCRLLFNSFSKLKIDENYKEKRRLFY